MSAVWHANYTPRSQPRWGRSSEFVDHDGVPADEIVDAGAASRVMAAYMPPPPEGGPSPWAWADEKSVRALLAPYDVQLTD